MNIAAYPKYDGYKDSGVEWLGNVPDVWGTKKLKFVTQIVKRIAGHEGPDVLSITQQGIKVKDITSGEGQLAENYSNYQLVNRGDFAMNHMDLLTGYVDISQFDGVVSPDYRVFRRTSDELDDRYLLLIFQIGYKQRIFFRYGQGVSLLGRWRFPAENFKEFQVPIPPLQEQRAIATFLDEKCTKLDAAVRIKEEQIALLRERRQILIQQTVTRGLNPAAPMKDSRIDWIGQIPAHWEVRRNFVLFREMKVSGHADLPVLSVSIHSGVSSEELSDEENIRSIIKIEDRTTYKEVRPGDVAYNMMRAWQGGIGAVSVHGMVSPAYVVARPRSALAADYFELLYRCPAFIRQMDAGSKGITDFRKRLYWDDFKNLLTLVPPRDEQLEIVQHIADVSKKIEDAISIKQDQIAALKEYKTSLINAAVTGKIKVA
ncbi:MAG TPA: restriction endonuclease subunit S [Amaricoccus sp.]|uniref:restriction endonuclease subunit S n=1 Tax=Amaricoccus sp. TaxID=1872485 RepID=UPI002CF03702|nr:restriction endonuclease subunit S [Amaricoccus sp.]HMQ92684.1 restriction endonuclease subunit S [Amaricoccus sp.]HMR52656.1 restriction endonuclease subunit S [Amaricoccus sp.]HMU00112.1 restriction endonuclease subunit S [Amaricoccus sp.]